MVLHRELPWSRSFDLEVAAGELPEELSDQEKVA
jgi:hypothetical protein